MSNIIVSDPIGKKNQKSYTIKNSTLCSQTMKTEKKQCKSGTNRFYRPISPHDERCTTPLFYGSVEGGLDFTEQNSDGIPKKSPLLEKHCHTSQEGHRQTYYWHNQNSFGNSYKHHNNNNTNSTGLYPNKWHNFNNYNNNSYNRDYNKKSSNRFRAHHDPLVRRVHGLTHRLKSRSDLMKIDPNPENLLMGTGYDQLSQAIYDVFMSKAQQCDTYVNKIQLWKDLFLCIRKCVSHYALYIVGSTMTGFGLNSSDIDMCLLIRPCTEDPRLDSLQQLHHIKNHLLKYDLIIHSELILAKVPILKFREESTGFEIDLNCNNAVGIYNTHLLYSYARCDWRVRPLVILIKLWAQANRINDAKNLTVSSYSWTLMLIHYLQCGISPPVLPCLHSLYPEHFNIEKSRVTDMHEDLDLVGDYQSYNKLSLGELLIGFFEYYANFDFGQYAISVRAGDRLQIEDCKQAKAPKNDQHQWKYICIEEPFDLTNTARSVYDVVAFRHIKTIITKSYEDLIGTKMLNSILPVNLAYDQPIMMF